MVSSSKSLKYLDTDIYFPYPFMRDLPAATGNGNCPVADRTPVKDSSVRTMKKILMWANRTFRPEQKAAQCVPFVTLFGRFQKILSLNNRSLELIAEANDKLGGHYVFDQQFIRSFCQQTGELVQQLIYNLEGLAPQKYTELYKVFREINNDIEEDLAGRLVISGSDFVMPYERISREYLNVVGGKNARLAEMKNVLGLRVPEGFAITAPAFQSFMEFNGLWPQVQAITEDWRLNRLTCEQASTKIMALISEATVPVAVKKAVQSELAQLHQLTGSKTLPLAVRSSAWGEDSEFSFAGQYKSMLNVAEENLFQGYKDVIASAFSDTAMEYRRQNGFGDQEMAMSVACQVMIDARISGVMYTIAPSSPRQDDLMISAAWGLGEPVVSGEINADQYTVSRKKPHRISSVSLVRKTQQLILQPEGGTVMQPVEVTRRSNACLTNDQINQLATKALEIEQFFRSHMDIEFAIDHQGQLIILQARPLNVASQTSEQLCDIAAIVKKYPVLMKDHGVIAQKGIGSGKIFVVNNSTDLNYFPSGAILVAKYASPLYAKVMSKARGIITDVGSATCHMATIAREFRVPTIVNTGNATEVFTTGQDVTIDAEENIIYEGTIDELCFYGLTTERIEETYEYRLLRRILKKIEPLALVDPTEKNFTPEGCRSFHDIIRFVHEKAVEEIIDLHYTQQHDPQSLSGKLRWELPLDMILIDIGGGITATDKNGDIDIDQIASIPMRAFVKGLGSPGAWNNEPLSVDIGSFISSLTRTFSTQLANPKYMGQNLAVISKEYANISLRLGYHFSIIDAYVSDNLNDNYIYFRFAGGVTDATRRSRRALFLKRILTENDFVVEVHDDLVIARIKKLPTSEIEAKIRLLGLLVGFTRQLDVLLISDQHINQFIAGFELLVKKNTNK
jgi:pyruvate,water dikinase